MLGMSIHPVRFTERLGYVTQPACEIFILIHYFLNLQNIICLSYTPRTICNEHPQPLTINRRENICDRSVDKKVIPREVKNGLTQKALFVDLHFIHSLQPEDLGDGHNLFVHVLNAAIGDYLRKHFLHGGDRSTNRVIAINQHLDLF